MLFLRGTLDTGNELQDQFLSAEKASATRRVFTGDVIYSAYKITMSEFATYQKRRAKLLTQKLISLFR